MKGISNTSRTLEYIRSQGWEADKVEQFNRYAGKFGQRKDLFGIIDIIALTENGITGIQSCGQSFSEHDQKILENPLSLKWIEKGGELLLISWRKLKLKRGGKALRWTPKIKKYSKADFLSAETYLLKKNIQDEQTLC
jgi:hypothetical protein